MSIELIRAKSDADLMKRSAYALDAIARLLSENAMRRMDGEGQEFMGEFLESGLREAIKLISDGLCAAGEDLQTLIEQMETEAVGGAK